MRRTALFVSVAAIVMLLASGVMAGNKVDICHIPPDDPDNAHTISVSVNALPAHLAHGDTSGDCLSVLTVTLTTDNFGGETSWELLDLTDNVMIDSRAKGDLASATIHVDEYPVDASHCFEFTIFDSLIFQDGICCSFGLGDYSLTLGAEEVLSPSGGAFGFSETVHIGNCP